VVDRAQPEPATGIPGDTDVLTAISGTGPSDLWAAGNVWASGLADNVNGQKLRVPYVLHWTGIRWVMTKIPNLGTEGSRLNGIQVLSPADAWAVGQTQDSNGAILTLTARYNGSAWTIVPSPDPGSLANLSGNSLDAVTTAGPATCSPSAPGKRQPRLSSAPWPSPPPTDELSPWMDGLSWTCVSPRRWGAAGEPGTSPEQLFAVGYAACFQSALFSVAAGRKLDASESQIICRVGLGPTGHGGFGLTVALDLHAPFLTREQGADLMARAHERCPYSNATRRNIDVALSVDGVPLPAAALSP
jgi:osmotically inducible protein OsmC